jgi:alkylhydroperoxidase family enzyme
VRELCELAERLTLRPASVGPPEIATLRNVELTDADIHDAIQVIAYFNYVNRIADAVGIPDEPEWAEP